MLIINIKFHTLSCHISKLIYPKSHTYKVHVTKKEEGYVTEIAYHHGDIDYLIAQ